MLKDSWRLEAVRLADGGMSWRKVARELGVPRSTVSDYLRAYFKGVDKKTLPQTSPKILFLDIETSRMLLGGWGLFNQNYGLEQVEEDWQLLSYGAKWLEDDEVVYSDITQKTEVQMLNELWDLLHEADIVVAHNGRRFDIKKIRARMIANGLKPYSPVRIVDTLEIAKKEFGFTSNKLAYLTELLCKRYIKSGHEKFHGYTLWKEFLRGNKEAIDEMRSYNQLDVLSLQELYEIISPWSSTLPVFDIYNDELVDMSKWVEDGLHFTNLGKYRKYRNTETGQFRRGRVNLLSKEKRKQILANIV